MTTNISGNAMKSMAGYQNPEADSELIAAWVMGWAAARNAPPPTSIHGGLRVNTASPKERVRYVLYAPDPRRIAALDAAAGEPPVSIKVCADVAVLAGLLPSRWKLHEQRYLMSAPLCHQARPPEQSRNPDFNLNTRRVGGLVRTEIRHRSGLLVASGAMALMPPHAIIDNIGTDPAFRRQGLGTIVMASLNEAALDAGAQTGLLVATPDGHALYSSVGWHVVAPYASAYLT